MNQRTKIWRCLSVLIVALLASTSAFGLNVFADVPAVLTDQPTLPAVVQTSDDGDFSIGDTSYATLAEAVSAAQAGAVIKVNATGTYTLPSLPQNVTIEGAVEGVVFNCVGSGNIASTSSGATFKNVSFNLGNNDYHGFQQGDITMIGCTLNGKLFTYHNSTFTNCKFVNEYGDYNLWIYFGNNMPGQTATFTNCTFTNNKKSKFLNVYHETANDYPHHLIMSGCEFVNNGSASKAAVNIKSTCGNVALRWNVQINNCTTEGAFPTKFSSDASFYYNSLVQVDDVKEAVVDGINLVLDGVKLYENHVNLKPEMTGLYVNSVADLKDFRDASNAKTSFAGKTIYLNSDLDLSGEEEWEPIGAMSIAAYPSTAFKGTFDGQGHKISNLKTQSVSPNWGCAGLFGSISGATIKNVTLENANIKSSHYAGGIVGYQGDNTNNAIENCHVIGGSIQSFVEYLGTEYDNGDKCGGIMGYGTTGTLKDCTVEGVTLSAYRHLGGVIGYQNSDMTVKDNTVRDCTIVPDFSQNYKGFTEEKWLETIGNISGNKSDSLSLLDNNVYYTTVIKRSAEIGGEQYNSVAAAVVAASDKAEVVVNTETTIGGETIAAGSTVTVDAGTAATSGSTTVTPKTLTVDGSTTIETYVVEAGAVSSVVTDVNTGDNIVADANAQASDYVDVAAVLAQAIDANSSSAANVNGMIVDVVADDQSTGSTSIVYDVNPVATLTTNGVATGQKVTLSNDQLKGATFKFHLDVTALANAGAKIVKAIHAWADGSETKPYGVLQDGANFYIEVETTHFSTWTLEGVTTSTDAKVALFNENGTFDSDYANIQDAFDNALDGYTVVLLDDVDATLNNQMYSTMYNLAIQCNLTLDGNGHKLNVNRRGITVEPYEANGARRRLVNSPTHADPSTYSLNVAFKDITIENVAEQKNRNGGTCISTRGKLGGLTLTNVTLTTAGSPYTQSEIMPLIIGGNQLTAPVITINNSEIIADANSAKGYAIATYNPVKLVTNNTTFKAAEAIRFLAANNSAGAGGSEVIISGANVSAKDVAFYFEKTDDASADNIDVKVTNSTFNVTEANYLVNYNATQNNLVTFGEGNIVNYAADKFTNIENAEGNVAMQVNGGRYNVVVADKYLAEGYICHKVADADGLYLVEPGTYYFANEDGTVKYPNWEEAYQLEAENATINVIASYELAANTNIDKNLTFKGVENLSVSEGAHFIIANGKSVATDVKTTIFAEAEDALTITETEDSGEYLYTANTAVAKIGSQKYATIAEAVENVPVDGAATTIELIATGADEGVIADANVAVKPGQNIEFDLKELTYNITNASEFTIPAEATVKFINGHVDADANVVNNGNLFVEAQVTGNVITNNGEMTISAATTAVTVTNNGEMLVESNVTADDIVAKAGTITFAGDDNTTFKDKITIDGGRVIISGGVFVTNDFTSDATKNYNLKISGGTFPADVADAYLEAAYVAQPNDGGTFTVTDGFYVAQIDGYAQRYKSLQAAVDYAYTNLAGDKTIKLLRDITGYTVIKQKEGLNLTIDGSYTEGETTQKRVVNGQFILHAQGKQSNPETLTIQNIAFNGGIDNFYNGWDAFIYMPNLESSLPSPYNSLGGAAATHGYVHNLTVDNCTFNGTSEHNVVAVKSTSASGPRNIVLTNNTATTLHSFAQLTAVTDFVARNINVTDAGSFINYNGGAGEAVIDSCNFTSAVLKDYNYAIRQKGASTATITLTNNNFVAPRIIEIGTNETTGGKLNVESGTYKGIIAYEDDIATPAPTTKVAISGGKFSIDLSTPEYAQFVADEYCGVADMWEDEATPNGVKHAVAKRVDNEKNVYYLTLQAAVDASPATNAEEADVITLLNTKSVDGKLVELAQDEKIDGAGVKVQAGQNIVFDLNGQTYNTINPTVGSTGTETNAFQLLKGSKVEFRNGVLTSDVAKILVQNYSDLTLNNVKVGNAESTLQMYAVSNNFGSMTATGNTEIIASTQCEPKVAFDVWYGMNPVYDDGVKVTFDENFTGTVTGNVEYGHHSRVSDANWQQKASVEVKNGTFDITFVPTSDGALEGANIAISGGTFTCEIPEAYCAEGFIPVVLSTNPVTYGVKTGVFVAHVEGITYGFETLAAAYAAAVEANAGTITLDKDITLTAPFEINIPGKSLTLDLNDKTLTGRTNLKGGNLTVKNGTVAGGDQQALNVYGSAEQAQNYSVLTIAEDATVTADVYGVCMFGSAASSNGYGAVVNIAGTVSTTGDGNNGAVFVSGNLGHNLGDMDNFINITGKVTSATDAAIALNGNATVNVQEGAEITGNTAIAIKRGTLNVTGGTVTATGEKNYEGTENYNGTEMTGAAVSMTNTYNNYGGMSVNISGGTFTSTNADALYKKEGTYANTATFAVSGGSFSSAVPEDFCAFDYVPKEEPVDGKYTVRLGQFVAHVGTQPAEGDFEARKGFEKVGRALSELNEGETVVLLANAALDKNYEAPNFSYNVVFGGYTVDKGEYSVAIPDGTTIIKVDKQTDIFTAKNAGSLLVETVHDTEHWYQAGGYCAETGGVPYATLQAAIDAAAEGATVNVLRDIELGSGFANVNKGVTINGNGHSVSSSALHAVRVTGTKDVTISNVEVNATQRGIYIGESEESLYTGKLTIQDNFIKAGTRGIDAQYPGVGFELNVNNSIVECNKIVDPLTTYINDPNNSRGINLITWPGNASDPGYTVNINNSEIRGFCYDINLPAQCYNIVVNMNGGKTYGRAVLNVFGDHNTFNMTGVEVHGINNQTGPTEGFACIVDNSVDESVDPSVNHNAQNNIYNIVDCQFIAELSEAAYTTPGSNASEYFLDIRGTDNVVNIKGTTTYENTAPADRGGFMGYDFEKAYSQNRIYFDETARETFNEYFTLETNGRVIGNVQDQSHGNLYPLNLVADVRVKDAGEWYYYASLADAFASDEFASAKKVYLVRDVTMTNDIVCEADVEDKEHPLDSKLTIVFGGYKITPNGKHITLNNNVVVAFDKVNAFEEDFFEPADNRSVVHMSANKSKVVALVHEIAYKESLNANKVYYADFNEFLKGDAVYIDVDNNSAPSITLGENGVVTLLRDVTLNDDFEVFADLPFYFIFSGNTVTANDNAFRMERGAYLYSDVLESDLFVADDKYDQIVKSEENDYTKYLVSAKESLGIYELYDTDITYVRTDAVENAAEVRYNRTYTDGNVDTYLPWYLPFDHEITEEDAARFSFYRINMVANSAAAGVSEMTDKIWLYISEMPVGEKMRGNKPYVFKPKAAGDYTFVSKNVSLLPANTNPGVQTETMYNTFTFKGTYNNPPVENVTNLTTEYYMAGGTLWSTQEGNPEVRVKAYRWILHKDSKNADYARVDIGFALDESEVTGIRYVGNPDGEVSYYTLDGMKVEKPGKGTYIVKSANGQVRKVTFK